MNVLIKSVGALLLLTLSATAVLPQSTNDGQEVGLVLSAGPPKLIEPAEPGGHFFQFQRGAKKKRAVDPQNRDIRRDVFVLQDVCLPVSHVFWRHGFDRGRMRHAADIQNRCEQHADLDGYGQVGEDRESKRRGPDGTVCFR